MKARATPAQFRTGAPQIAVVVPSHDRPVRLRWLLNALEEQTIDPGHWELIVVHDSLDWETDHLLASHPLAAKARVRAYRVGRGQSAGAKRNVGWQSTTATTVLFTHDDCRPEQTWLERALATTTASPNSIVIGPVRPDPDERRLLELSSLALTQDADALDDWCNACNVAYPRGVLSAHRGFIEDFSFLDEIVLRSKAAAAGTRLVADPSMTTYHSIVVISLAGRLVRAWSRRELPRAVATHRLLRQKLRYRVATSDAHLLLIAAALGIALARRRSTAAGLALPWITANWRVHSPTWRGIARSVTELPIEALVQGSEIVGLAWASAVERTLVL